MYVIALQYVTYRMAASAVVFLHFGGLIAALERDLAQKSHLHAKWPLARFSSLECRTGTAEASDRACIREAFGVI
jgi:hypothetical protein